MVRFYTRNKTDFRPRKNYSAKEIQYSNIHQNRLWMWREQKWKKTYTSSSCRDGQEISYPLKVKMIRFKIKTNLNRKKLFNIKIKFTFDESQESIFCLSVKSSVCADESSVVGELPGLGELSSLVRPSKHQGNIAVGLNGRPSDVEDENVAPVGRRRLWRQCQVLRGWTSFVLKIFDENFRC